MIPSSHRWRRILLGPCRGLKLPVPGRRGWWIMLGGYEREVAPWTRWLARPGDLVADIGSAWGYWTAAFARHGALISAYEMDEHRADLTRTALTENNLGGLVAHEELARIPSGVDAVKMDVEGSEANILRNSEDVLATDRPRLIIEWHSAQLLFECLETLADYGYDCRKLALSGGPFRSSCDTERGWIVGIPEARQPQEPLEVAAVAQ